MYFIVKVFQLFKYFSQQIMYKLMYDKSNQFKVG